MTAFIDAFPDVHLTSRISSSTVRTCGRCTR
jgi:hypothetical protein